MHGRKQSPPDAYPFRCRGHVRRRLRNRRQREPLRSQKLRVAPLPKARPQSIAAAGAAITRAAGRRRRCVACAGGRNCPSATAAAEANHRRRDQRCRERRHRARCLRAIAPQTVVARDTGRRCPYRCRSRVRGFSQRPSDAAAGLAESAAARRCRCGDAARCRSGAVCCRSRRRPLRTKRRPKEGRANTAREPSRFLRDGAECAFADICAGYRRCGRPTSTATCWWRRCANISAPTRPNGVRFGARST